MDGKTPKEMFRELARKFHPDHGRTDNMFQLLIGAQEVADKTGDTRILIALYNQEINGVLREGNQTLKTEIGTSNDIETIEGLIESVQNLLDVICGKLKIDRLEINKDDLFDLHSSLDLKLRYKLVSIINKKLEIQNKLGVLRISPENKPLYEYYSKGFEELYKMSSIPRTEVEVKQFLDSCHSILIRVMGLVLS